jgi:hypothetical protein
MRIIATAKTKTHRPKTWLLSLFLVFVTAISWAQEKTVTGVVRKGDNGDAVVSATVQVKGTPVRTLTNSNGEYSIRASGNQSLVVSAIGYTPMEKQVGGQTVIGFSLATSNAQMESVVVTALGDSQGRKSIRLFYHYRQRRATH